MSGTLFVISAPSGTGKSTLARRLLESVPGLAFSISYTTRPRRAGEESGRDYHFVDEPRFEAMVAAGELLEWAPVFGRKYGTGRRATEEALGKGLDLLLDIDVQGAAQVRDSGLPAVSIFVLPPDFTTLEDRLRHRGSEDPKELALRLHEARREAMEYDHFDYVVLNADLEEATGELVSIVRAERARCARRRERVKSVLATFPS
ncbi:MAG TPA: guanylate kinase [Candidatus Polarisedimenticolaceae bacterium]|nr:guanylate kinase [Candidatus Polarisedimenticolaceae bacterium]